jgi:enterochelin esterase-like enzyme
MPFGFIKQDLKLERQFPAKEDFAEYFSDVVRTIENEYKEIDSKRRALAGLSMGGKQALEYALDHLDMFEALGAFSAALHARQSGHALPDMLAQLRYQAANLRNLHLLYLSCGERDETGKPPGSLLQSNKELARTLEAINGINLHVEWKRGKHDWGVWKNSIRQFLLLWST